jgi:hypothetical protein
MQRLGHLRMLLGAAFGRRRGSMDNLAELLANVLAAKVPSHRLGHQNVEEWLNKRRQAEKYGGTTAPQQVQLQDAYLSDPQLPSFTGSHTRQTTIDIVRWALHLGLVRRDTISLSSKGEALRLAEADRLPRRLTDYDAARNPFAFHTHGGKLMWGVLTLRSDAVILSDFLSRLPVDTLFDRTEAGDLLADTFLSLGRKLESERKTVELRRATMAVAKIADAVERQRGRTDKGLREHVVAVRLEPLVDLGFMTKPDKYRWAYVLPSQTRRAFVDQNPLMPDWPHASPRDCSVGSMVEAAGWKVRRLEDQVAVWRYLHKGFSTVRSPVNFAGVEETLLAALGAAGDAGWFFELDQAKQLVLDAQRAAPREVRINVDRFGALRHVRIPERFPLG